MIRSMTSFGRATFQGADFDLTVEMRSVNNRYFDCSVRLPRPFSGLEERIKPYLQSRGISRGKVEVFITSVSRTPAAAGAEINEANLRAYLDALYRLRDEFGLRDDISVMRVAANPAVFAPEQQQTDLDELWAQLLPALSEATDHFLASRDAEGARLAADLRGKLEHLKELTDRIEALSLSNTENYRTKIMNESFHGTSLFVPGVGGYQQHLWYAGISNCFLTFVNLPGSERDFSGMRPGYWFGNLVFPYVKQFGRELVCRYLIPDSVPTKFTHAYFPAPHADETREDGSFRFARVGESYLALWCSLPLEKYTEEALTDCELRAYGNDVIWYVKVGSMSEDGSFDKFISECKNSVNDNYCLDLLA